MPNRLLRDWTDSEIVNQLDATAEVLFLRLIMKADDFGRFTSNPRLIKSLCFPLRDGLSDENIGQALEECEAAGLLRRYESEGKRCLEIRNFNQRLRAFKSRYPAPPENLKKSTPQKITVAKKPVIPPGKMQEMFAQFWEVYPRKVGKRAAMDKWERLKPPLAQCLRAIEHQRLSPQWRKDGGQYIPHPATWLNQGRWEDAPKIEVTRKVPAKPMANPAGWLEWLAVNYPKADRNTPFHKAHADVQREFLHSR